MKIYLKEDFEFYKTSNGKLGVDKVITKSTSGKTFKGDKKDADIAVKRIPLSKMSDEDKELAKAAYKALKKDGSIKNVDKKFKVEPKPDVVMKSDGVHADIYYDDNTDGEPDEKDVRLAASKKRTTYQKLHGLREDARGMIDGINLDKVASNIEETYELIEGNIPEDTLVARRIDYIFNDWVENGWYDDYGDVNISPRALETIKLLKKSLSNKESREYFNYGDLYDELYDLLFGSNLEEKVGTSDEYSIYTYWTSRKQWLPVDEQGSVNGDSLVFSSKKEAAKDPVIEILKAKKSKIKIAPANWNGKE